jgi:hypothetical protein
MQSPYRFLDCIEFQSKIVGKDLLLCAEVEQIESHCNAIESKWSYLQLWEGKESRTIKSFSVKKEKTPEFNSRSK